MLRSRLPPVTNIFFLECYGDHRDLHSFPTRRSSDLGTLSKSQDLTAWVVVGAAASMLPLVGARAIDEITAQRSEEHTSELQSRGHLVCRLLLEKKNAPSSEI